MQKLWIETPLIESVALSKIAGCRIFLKLELLQPSGSFKSRGVGNLIRSAFLDPENRDKELHFYSSSGGNAGLAAITAARDLGCPCTVVVPLSTKPLMINKLRAAGAAVVQHGASWFDADTYLQATFIDNQEIQASRRKNIYVCPYDHPVIWKGAATMVSEIAAQLPPREASSACNFPADAIICSVGGGGLFNGVVEGLDEYLQSQPDSVDGAGTQKNVQILAVETQGADSLAYALQCGSPQPLAGITSLATSLGAVLVADRTFENARSPPAGIDVVNVVGSDADAARGVVLLADNLRLQVELACGISVEVGIGEKLKEIVPDLTPESRVVIIVCGGSNITAEMIAEYRVRLQNGWK